MAKKGFLYYNVDTDRYSDIRIKRLKKDFGTQGIAVYDYLLCQIYRDKGCFLVWDESTAFDVADYFGLKDNTVFEIVKYCGVVGLFDAVVFTGGILTSRAIQERYLDMCKRAKRSDVEIPKEFLLVENSGRNDKNSGKSTETSGRNAETSGSFGQNKVEYSKENNTTTNGNHVEAEVEKSEKPKLIDPNPASKQYHPQQKLDRRKCAQICYENEISWQQSLGIEKKDMHELLVTFLKSNVSFGHTEEVTLKDFKFHFSSWYRGGYHLK